MYPVKTQEQLSCLWLHVACAGMGHRPAAPVSMNSEKCGSREGGDLQLTKYAKEQTVGKNSNSIQ